MRLIKTLDNYKVYYSSIEKEYIVKPTHNLKLASDLDPEDMWYYTDDLDDAIDTAKDCDDECSDWQVNNF